MACSPLKCPFLSLPVSNLPPCDLQKLKNFQIFEKSLKCIIVLHASKQWTGLYIHPVHSQQLTRGISCLLSFDIVKQSANHYGILAGYVGVLQVNHIRTKA